MTSVATVFTGMALFLGIDALALQGVGPDPATNAVPACRFTLEQNPGEIQPGTIATETWVLTCHRMLPNATSTVGPVSLRRVATPTNMAASPNRFGDNVIDDYAEF